MARYKTLDNGNYGYAYNKLYIVKDNPLERRSTYSILDESFCPLLSSLEDFHEAEWQADLLAATDEEKTTIKELSKLEIFEINGKILSLFEDYPDGKYPKPIKKKLKTMIAVRDRKAENKSLM